MSRPFGEMRAQSVEARTPVPGESINREQTGSGINKALAVIRDVAVQSVRAGSSTGEAEPGRVENDSLGDENSCTGITRGGDNIETNNTDTSFNSNPWWLPNLFICMGVVIPGFILMRIFILCKRCKNLRRRKTQKAQVQYADLLKCNEFVCVQYSEETLTTAHPALPPELATLLNMHL